MPQLCLALLTREQLGMVSEWPTGIAVYYAPGSISSYTGETLSYCFLQHDRRGSLWVLSRDDAAPSPALTQAAVQAIDRERHRLDANLPPTWPQGIHPESRHWARLLFRLHYFEPQQSFVTGLLKAVRQGAPLSPAQREVIEQIYTERGQVAGLRQRQHTQWRLRQLGALELKPADERTVRRFWRWAHQPAGLRDSRLPVITALEAQYYRSRRTRTHEVAEKIWAALASHAGE